MIIDDLKSRISNFLLAGQWDAFFEWFAPLPLDIENCGEPDAIRFVHSIQRDVADFDEGFLDEYNLKQNLRAKLYPTSATVDYFVMSAAAGSNEIVSSTSTFLVPGETVAVFAGAVFSTAP
jgi:hypothetical protein